MKTLIYLTISIVIASGCTKKDWNCTCNVNGNEYQKTINHATKSKASTDCGNYGKSIGQSYYGNYTYKCNVK